MNNEDVMINKCGKEYETIIFSYIGQDYPECLYLYLNLKKYGFDNTTTDVYIQRENNVITAVLLKYYTCLHVFSKDNDFNSAELGIFIEQNGFSMVYCMSSTASRIYECLSKETLDLATLTTGWVAKITKIDKQPKGISVKASKQDFEQIVRLIYEDEDIGKSYKYEMLACQLEERNSEGYARNLVIKNGDLVIAHACTNAEIDKIAVVAELLVRENFRRQGYASEIWRDLCGQLLLENKEVYSFYYSEESRALHRKIGFNEVCEWAKIVIQQKNS